MTNEPYWHEIRYPEGREMAALRYLEEILIRNRCKTVLTFEHTTYLTHPLLPPEQCYNQGYRVTYTTG